MKNPLRWLDYVNLPFHKNQGFQKINDRNWANLFFKEILSLECLNISDIAHHTQNLSSFYSSAIALPAKEGKEKNNFKTFLPKAYLELYLN